MESLQKQVITLSNKVDALYQVIEQLNGKVSDALSECRVAHIPEKNEYMKVDGTGQYSAQSYKSRKPTLEHKDVLVDGMGKDTHRQSGEKEMAPEIQIQRLTAQLTAAYNRIAALEEQLLRERIH